MAAAAPTAETPLILVEGAGLVALRDLPPVQYELGTMTINDQEQSVWVADGPAMVGFRSFADLARVYNEAVPRAVIWTVRQTHLVRCHSRYVVLVRDIEALPGGMDRFVEQAHAPFHEMDKSYLLGVMRLAIEFGHWGGQATPYKHSHATIQWRIGGMADSYMYECRSSTALAARLMREHLAAPEEEATTRKRRKLKKTQ